MQSNSTRPLSLYIHWPFCASKCPYCDFNSHVREQIDHVAWHSALLAELHHMASFVRERELVSIFFGGGTPSLMPPHIAADLIATAKQLWPHQADIEISLEANPTSVEAKNFAALKSAGVNRLSLGVQSLNDEALKFLGRQHSAAEALDALEVARQHWHNISFDLIYALPNQTEQAWRQELARALSFNTPHFSLYQLTIEPNTNFYHRATSGNLPQIDEDTSRTLFDITQSTTAAAGLHAYEISNHAKTGFQCQHNIAYWQLDDYIGIGPGAHGRFQMNTQERTATTTIKSPEKWLATTQANNHGYDLWQPYPTSQAAEELLIMNLRLNDGMAWQRLDGFSPSASTHMQQQPTFQTMQHDGWIDSTPSHLRVTDTGRPFLNHLIAQLADLLPSSEAKA